jgi:hypothetical protein
VRRKDNDVVLITRLKLTLFLHGSPLFGWGGLDFILHGLHGMTEKAASSTKTVAEVAMSVRGKSNVGGPDGRSGVRIGLCEG